MFKRIVISAPRELVGLLRTTLPQQAEDVLKKFDDVVDGGLKLQTVESGNGRLTVSASGHIQVWFIFT